MGQKVGCNYSLLTLSSFHLVFSFIGIVGSLSLLFSLLPLPSLHAQGSPSSIATIQHSVNDDQPASNGGTIQGAVWHDTNNNGLYQRGASANTQTESRQSGASINEPTISGVRVSLFSVTTRPSSISLLAGTSTTTSTSTSVTWIAESSADGISQDASSYMLDLIATASTDISGTFSFNNLAPGDYVVEFGTEGIPAGHRVTAPRSIPAPGNRDEHVIASNVEPATRRSPLITISESDSLFSANMGIWFPVSVGNRVWFDDDGDGIQDPNEHGVSNVGISLFTIDGNGVLAFTEQSTHTDDEGFYTFDELDPGIYLVEFDLMNLPPNHWPTLPNSGDDDALDSDASARSTTSSPTAFLESGASDSTLDLGLTTPVEIGDKVWLDSDLDGYQDEGEVGLGGVEIHLYQEGGQLSQVTTSDRAGWYLFSDILPGTYYISVQLPSGRQFSPQTVGRYAAADSDIDPNTGESERITLQAGDSAPNLDIGLSELVPTGVEQTLHQLFVPLMQ